MAILALPGIIVAYLFFAVIFSLIPVNNSFQQAEKGVEIFVKSNGVHTDIVLPVKNETIDWKTKIKEDDFKPSHINYIAFGWGDKGFYLNTPTWADLKFSTAFNALFWLSSSAMHVTCYQERPVLNEKTKRISITSDQYRQLIEHIDASFQKDKDGKYILIPGHHYKSVNDNFYEGIGTYSLFTTCNSWTNSGLKKTGIKNAFWAPFEKSVMWHLE